MGLLYFRVDDSELADEWFAKAIERGSMSYIPYYLLGFSDSDPDTRVQHFRQATVYNPRFAPAYGELARLYANDLVFEEAMPLATQASALDPDDARYQILTAQVLLRMDQPRAARVVAQQALRAGFDAEEQEDLRALVDEIDEYEKARAEPVLDSAPPTDGNATSPSTDTPRADVDEVTDPLAAETTDLVHADIPGGEDVSLLEGHAELRYDPAEWVEQTSDDPSSRVFAHSAGGGPAVVTQLPSNVAGLVFNE